MVNYIIGNLRFFVEGDTPVLAVNWIIATHINNDAMYNINILKIENNYKVYKLKVICSIVLFYYRTVHWYWDEAGSTGKTLLAKRLYADGAAYFDNTTKKDIACALATDW